MAVNPTFSRIDREAAQGAYAGFGQQPANGSYPPPQAPPTIPPYQPAGQHTLSDDQLESMYAQPSAGPVQTGRLTLDDVVMKSLILFAVMIVAAAATWQLGPATGMTQPLWLLGMFGSLVLSFVIGFAKKVNVPLILVHAVLQGLFVGAVSVTYASYPGFEGVVPTAVIATLSTAAGMFVAWKAGFIKVSSKVRRIFGMMAMGYLVFLLVNLAASFMGMGDGWGIYAGPLGILVSLLGVGMAAFSFALDFDSVDRGIAAGAPEKYSWLMAHGIIASLVWLYIEFLRLFSILNRD